MRTASLQDAILDQPHPRVETRGEALLPHGFTVVRLNHSLSRRNTCLAFLKLPRFCAWLAHGIQLQCDGLCLHWRVEVGDAKYARG